MDIVSHGLWGGVAFGRKSKKAFWTAFAFGILPDFLAFAPFFVQRILSAGEETLLRRPEVMSVPNYVYDVYQITHSLIMFMFVFGVVWLIRKKPFIPMLAWPLHILVDIPTHSIQFFPTPFLWPLSNVRVNGHSWGTPEVFIPNVIALAAAYLWFYWAKKKRKAALSERC